MVARLLGLLLGMLGFIRTLSLLQDILEALIPAQGRLVRLPFSVQQRKGLVPPY